MHPFFLVPPRNPFPLQTTSLPETPPSLSVWQRKYATSGKWGVGRGLERVSTQKKKTNPRKVPKNGAKICQAGLAVHLLTLKQGAFAHLSLDSQCSVIVS